MWKPGTEKPKRKKDSKASTSTTAAGVGDDGMAAKSKPSQPSVKKLSSGTRNMRFMQRTAVEPRQLQSSLAAPREEEPPSTTDDTEQEDVDMLGPGDDDDGNEQTPSRFTHATAQDMYGTVLMGRRSFGGFRPIVEQMQQQGEASLNSGNKKKDRKRKRVPT